MFKKFRYLAVGFYKSSNSVNFNCIIEWDKTDYNKALNEVNKYFNFENPKEIIITNLMEIGYPEKVENN